MSRLEPSTRNYADLKRSRGYFVSIDPDELGDAERQRTNEILLFSMHLEQAGDALDQNQLPHLAKRIRRRLTFSQVGQ